MHAQIKKTTVTEGNNQPERILCAAILYCDEIIAGYRHSDCFIQLDKLAKNFTPKHKDVGFMTSYHRFVTREEAFKIAKEQNQIWHNIFKNDKEGLLTSEDLY